MCWAGDATCPPLRECARHGRVRGGGEALSTGSRGRTPPCWPGGRAPTGQSESSDRLSPSTGAQATGVRRGRCPQMLCPPALPGGTLVSPGGGEGGDLTSQGLGQERKRAAVLLAFQTSPLPPGLGEAAVARPHVHWGHRTQGGGTHVYMRVAGARVCRNAYKQCPVSPTLGGI